MEQSEFFEFSKILEIIPQFTGQPAAGGGGLKKILEILPQFTVLPASRQPAAEDLEKFWKFSHSLPSSRPAGSRPRRTSENL